jgi:hypothetical protein
MLTFRTVLVATCAAILALLPSAIEAAPITPGNLVIYRVGDGSAALTNAATRVFVDEYDTNGNLVQSIAMPTSVSGSNRRLTASGTATSEGQLTVSADGNWVVLAGYDADVGTTGVASTTSAAVNRVVARINIADGEPDTSTALSDAYSGNNIRGVASLDGSQFWLSGTGTSTSNGVRYTTHGGNSSTRLSSSPTNIRTVRIFNGQLFASMMTGSFRLATVGSGTPTGPADSQTITNLPGYATSDWSNYAFVMFDLDPTADFNGTGLDTLYVTVDSGTPGGGVYKWSWNPSTSLWEQKGSVALTNVRGLTGFHHGSSVTLYVTTPDTLETLTDTSGYGNDMTGSFTTLATAASNTVFRGVAMVPIPEAGPWAMSGSLLAVAGLLWLGRRLLCPGC